MVIRHTGPDGKPEVHEFSWNGSGPVPPVPPAPPVAPVAPVAPNIQLNWGQPADPDFEKKMEAWGRQMEQWGQQYGERYAQQAQARSAEHRRDARG